MRQIMAIDSVFLMGCSKFELYDIPISKIANRRSNMLTSIINVLRDPDW